MKLNIKNLILPAMALATLSFAACGDWIEPESVTIKTPSLEEQNPALYAQYVEALKAYKSGDHKVVFVTAENPVNAAAANQSQHLTTLPDSVDFIVLNNPDNLHSSIASEFAEVRKKSTRVLYVLDFSTYEAEWREMAKANAELTEEDALANFGERTTADLSLCDKYGYDGVIFSYTGRSLVSIREEEMAAYDARQKSFLEPVAAWRAAHADHAFVFMGRADNLTAENRAILSGCDYIVVPTDTAASADDLSLKVLAVVSAEGVPSDRVVVTALEIRPDDKDQAYGYFGVYDENGNKLRALPGTAEWVNLVSTSYTRAGMYIKDVEPDYFNRTFIYPHLREAISILNPSPKN